MIRRRTVTSRERGSSMAEFAIALTASLTLITGIVEFGRGIYTYHLVANAARMGSRYAIVRGGTCTATGCPATQTSVQTYVRGLAPELNGANLTVTSTWTTTTSCTSIPANTAGCQVAVRVTYPLTFAAVPMLPRFTMSMSSTSTMIMSQ
ncbi:MAG TPA: TadE/TadG family type IV pilus assembly protein [Candidatus Elarobacter sp.]